MLKLKNSISRNSVLIILVAVASVVGVFMNLFTSLRWQGAPGLTFGNIFFTWIPMLIADILIEVYGKRKGFVVPAFIYLLQGLFFLLAVILVTTHPEWLIFRTDRASGVEIFPIAFGDTFQVWSGSILANYAGFFTNSVIMYLLKKHMPRSTSWYSLMFRAIVSTFFGQFVDNAVFMSVGLGMWDWKSIGLRQLVEVGMEVVFFPITWLTIKKISALPEFITNDGKVIR